MQWLLCNQQRQDFLSCFCFCRRAGFLSSKATSEKVVLIKFSGYSLSRRCVLKFVMLSSNNVLKVNPDFPSPQKPTFPNFNSISVSTISSALALLEA